jgi:hypothetical protein
VELVERVRADVLEPPHVIALVRRDHERHAGPAGGERVGPQDPAVLDDELASHVEPDARARALLAQDVLARRERLLERLGGGLARHPLAVIGDRDHHTLIHRTALQ